MNEHDIPKEKYKEKWINLTFLSMKINQIIDLSCFLLRINYG